MNDRPDPPLRDPDADLSGLTEAIARFAASLTADALTPEVRHMSSRCLIDGLGVMIAGSDQPGMAPLLAFIEGQGGTGEARLLGRGSAKVPATRAALWAGTAGHAMDWDDTQLAEGPGRPYGLLMHPTVPPLAAALALCDLVAKESGAPVTGERFLVAFNAGFEAGCKIAEAIDPDHYMRGFHTSGTIGTFAAAVTAATLLGFDAAQIAATIGVAASTASGIRAGFGTMVKPLHVGRAAENGVTAALLVREGFTAPPDALDGKWGYLAVAGPGGEPHLVRDRMGAPFSMVSPGLSIKPYPSGVLTHPSMDAMLFLMREEGLSPQDIESVTLNAGRNVLGPIRYRTAKTELEGKFSFAFLLSAIILAGRCGKAEMTDAFVRSPECQAMQERIETRFDQDVEDMGWDRIRSRLEVALTDGRTVTRWADENYRGSPHNPLTDAEVEDKFLDCADGLLPPDTARDVMDTAWRIGEIADAGAILTALTRTETTR